MSAGSLDWPFVPSCSKWTIATLAAECDRRGCDPFPSDYYSLIAAVLAEATRKCEGPRPPRRPPLPHASISAIPRVMQYFARTYPNADM